MYRRSIDHQPGLSLPVAREGMNERQRRSDVLTANAVARGLNILAVRNQSLAQHYMEYKGVPGHVISRVLHMPASRRQPSAGQVISEAITPSAEGGDRLNDRR
jgi:hypothetical protein